jgi:GTP-binding protein Era
VAQTGPQAAHRAGFVALAGCPNVGKSTLMNALLGEAVAVVTPKPQTTRRAIRGVLTLPRAQVVFVDTPGIHEPKFPLNASMVRAAREAIAEADAVLLVVDAGRPPGARDREVADLCRSAGRPVVLVLNKWDMVALAEADARRAAFAALGEFRAVVPLSALDPEAATDLLPRVVPLLPEGPAFYPEDQLTDQTLRDVVAERVREQVTLQCGQEIPYAVAVAVDRYDEGEEAEGDRVWATIYVERPSQKAILIGRGGTRIKAIGTAARHRLEEVAGRPVHLRLFVKVRPGWRRDAEFLRELGYR